MTAQLAAPAIGYRGFLWEGNGPLRSTGVSDVWPISREPFYAACRKSLTRREGSPHSAPVEDCACGLHAYSDPSSVKHSVGGVVIGYGNLVIHPDGWRAATAELVALVADPRIVSGAAGSVSRAALDLLAEQYGVRVLESWLEGKAIACERGAEPIPKILHAEAEAWDWGPERREPLFPGTGSSLERRLIEDRLREVLPWLKREMIASISIESWGGPRWRRTDRLVPMHRSCRLRATNLQGMPAEFTILL